MAKPLKFTPELERAVLEKNKTQTCRLMEPQPEHVDGGYFWPSRKDFMIAWAAEDSIAGDRNDGFKPSFEFDRETPSGICPYGAIGRWLPVGDSVQQITGLRIERIQSITEDDCMAEGCRGGHDSIPGYMFSATPKEHFWRTWESIYPGSWERNDFCWVIGFKKVEGEK